MTRRPDRAALRHRARRALLALCVAGGLGVSPLEGQITARARAQAIAALVSADPVPEGDRLTEVRVTQPMLLLSASAWRKRLRAVVSLNAEGLTLRNGELAPGGWGEGFVDRRHPHTYVHEAMVLLTDPLGTAEQSGMAVAVGLGKGFVPFGTDDPMGRPFLRYPVNHHLAQILERAIALGQLQLGTLVLEGALFNGDEPERPGQWPRIGGRFGDSWSLRAVTMPAEWLELQGSHATVASPEHRPGAGTDARKWSASARAEGALGRGGSGYALVEWAYTEELNGMLGLRSWLAEGALTRGGHRLSYRWEQTIRPEEERLASPFRTIRPHLDDTVLGASRWTIHTVAWAGTLRSSERRSLAVAPFLEVSTGTVAKAGPGVFDPAELYAKARFWSLSMGLRLSWDLQGHRMGRYGLLKDRDHAH